MIDNQNKFTLKKCLHQSAFLLKRQADDRDIHVDVGVSGARFRTLTADDAIGNHRQTLTVTPHKTQIVIGKT